MINCILLLMNLTKSLFLTSLDCHRKLWFSSRQELPEHSLSDNHKFKQGYAFQEFVVRTLDDPIILGKFDQATNLQATQDALQTGKPLVEAGFLYKGVYIRSDILFPNGDGYDLVEVKASTKTKPEHIPDLAIQLYVLEKSGLNMKRVFVYHLNKEYVRQGELTEEIIEKTDVTESVMSYPDLPTLIREAQAVLAKDDAPEIIMGSYCSKCPLKPACSKQHLPQHSVLELTNWRTYWKLYNDGIKDIFDIPDDTKINDKDAIIIQATKENKVVVQQVHLKQWLNQLTYPLFHFDFETFDLALPRFDNSRPWQKIPFQYSCHVEHEDGTIEHHEFLAKGEVDPRPALLASMKRLFQGTTGDIVVYYQTFEKGRIQELITDFPEHASWLEDVLERIVDLYVPFNNRWYYHPEQHGSASIKKVLPAINGLSYGGLDIQNGADASILYYISHYEPPFENKEHIRESLLKYCELDTLAEVEILKELKQLV